MAHEKRNVAKDPTPPMFEPAFKDMMDYEPMNVGGPGGNNTLTENNEKGILESGLQRVIARGTSSKLSASHPRVGIYAEGNTN